ncbi:hypothetical protein F5887DRAFT_1075096 [Amanita rubescens]|nr:hypothetical protein F5887DRAFT_1075096 [Amanita rubescens]
MAVPISTFKGPREPEQHSTMIHQLLSELLIGHGSAWEQDQFQAFASGLRLGICNINDIVKPRSHEETQNDIYLYAFKLVATLWNNQIESYSNGHLRVLVGSIVSKEDDLKGLKSPGMTRALTDMASLPAKSMKDVMLHLKYMPSLLPSRMWPPFYISVCMKKMEVTLDPEVGMNLLLEPVSMTDTADTAFDIWLHTVLVMSANDYNAL